RCAGPRSGRDEPHHAQTVMPGGNVVDQFARLRTNGSKQHRPREEFRVPYLVELLDAHVQQGVGVSRFELSHQPPIEIELRIQVCGAPRKREPPRGGTRAPSSRPGTGRSRGRPAPARRTVWGWEEAAHKRL